MLIPERPCDSIYNFDCVTVISHKPRYFIKLSVLIDYSQDAKAASLYLTHDLSDKSVFAKPTDIKNPLEQRVRKAGNCEAAYRVARLF